MRFGATPVVDDVSFEIAAGEKFALVGESGSGKSITALSVLGLVDGAETSGAIRFAGIDLAQASERELLAVRGGEIAMIFQEPMTALNPLHTIGAQIVEVLGLHSTLGRREARARAIELLAKTGIAEPERRIDAWPHQLSGGQRQRAMIAMALAGRPKLLIADEPTTALDVTIQAQILALLDALQAEMGLALLFITHDLNLVRRVTHRVGVMERGRLVESGPTEQVFAAPQHAYTQRLLASRPRRLVEPVAADAPCLIGSGAAFVDGINDFLKELQENAAAESRPFNAMAVRRKLNGGSALPLDSSGRFIMPDNLAELGELKGELFFLGMGPFFEIWDYAHLMSLKGEEFEVAQAQARAEKRALDKKAVKA